MLNLITLLVVGFIVGLLARAFVPGDDSMKIWQTALLGIVGSYVGGLLFSLFPGGASPLDFSGTGFVGSVIGAMIALVIWRRVRS